VDALAREFRSRFETIDIDGVRIVFPEGWGLVRASNTNPYLTLRFEGPTVEAVENMQRMVYDALRRFPYVTLPA
jgi:phosphomannomutase / phosphoglucomutase